MKKVFVITIVAFAVITACKEEHVEKEGPLTTGDVEFSFLHDTKNQRQQSNIQAASLLISIEDLSGNSIYSRRKISLYTFEGKYLSEPISLNTGEYRLTEFLVLNENNEIIYAAPVANSKLAHLVTNPLPFQFRVTEDETLKIIPQVLDVSSLSPESFGYATFSFEVVRSVNFLLSVFIYDSITENLELTTAKLKVSGNGEVLYEGEVKDSTNLFRVREGYSSYQLKVGKAGYKSYEKSFTTDELGRYQSTPLKIILNPGEDDDSYKRTNNWFFGRNAGLSFNTGTPVALTGGITSEVNTTAVISDEEGNLLFYTGGNTVYNRNHQVMSDGTGLDAYGYNISQQAIIVPHPGINTKFYIFTIGEDLSQQLLYHEVDLADNTLGRVVIKNKVLSSRKLLRKN